LVEKFKSYTQMADKYGYLLPSEEVYFAKQCALIAVDEILNVIGEYIIEPFIFDIEYYQEVKQEIEKL